MSDNYCKNCGQYKSSFHEHECPPCWQGILPNEGDPEDESTFYKAFGHDAESAAIDIAERKFSDWEYPREVEIWVRQNPSDEWSRIEVSVESVLSFSASPVGGV
jgi:hypothetical protein